MYKKVLITAQSPLQLMGISEWILNFKPKSWKLVFIYDPRSVENIKQMKAVANLLSLGTFEVLVMSGKSTFLGYVKFLRASKVGGYDCLLIGGYGSFHQALLANLTCDVFLIDEGSDSLSVYEKIASKGLNWGVRERGLKVLRFALFGLETVVKNPRRVKHYSFIINDDHTGLPVVRHSFESLKSQVLSQSESGEHRDRFFYIDTPLVENNILPQGAEHWTYSVAIKITNSRVSYVPHREQLFLNQGVYPAASFGLRILQVDLPVEIYFLLYGYRPSKIFLTSSSALFSLKAIFNECDFYVFDIRSDVSDSRYLEYLDRYYQSAVEIGAQVIIRPGPLWD